MAENKNASLYNHEDYLNGMEEKPLMKAFMKYFTDTPANMLRSVDFGKSIFNFFAPSVVVPEGPVDLLNAARSLFSVGFADQNITDEMFVDFLLDKILKEPALVTYDMVADLVESEAYKKFGKVDGTAKEVKRFGKKREFENWLYTKSMLSKINDTNAVDVVLNHDGMTRIVNFFSQENTADVEFLTLSRIYQNQIKDKVNNFDETYVQNMTTGTLGKLKKIAKDDSQDYLHQIKDVYTTLGDKDQSDFIGNLIDASTLGVVTRDKCDAMTLGEGLYANKVLLAVGQRKKWSDKDFSEIYLKFPVEKRAEKIEEQTASKEVKRDPKFHPVFDVVRTFSGSLVGAAAISAVTAIPGVGRFVGPILGISTVVTAGFGAGMASYKKAKKEAAALGQKLDKADAMKIARNTGLAMARKAAPYALAIAAGPVWARVGGAAIVAVKTFCQDIERRANLQREALEQNSTPKRTFSEYLNLIVNLKSLNKKDRWKSVAYAFFKGGAVFAGSSIGREIGSKLGSKIDVEQVKEGFQNKVSKLTDKFSGLRNNNTESNLVATQSENGDINLTAGNEHRMAQIKDVELTDNARATVHTDNHRQYIGGEQHDWYDNQGEQNAIETLEKCGLSNADSEAVLRKLGSAARFFGGEYQETLDHLCDGKFDNQDVEQIFGALNRIDETGDLIRGHDINTDSIGAKTLPSHDYDGAISETASSTELPDHNYDAEVDTSAGEAFSDTAEKIVTETSSQELPDHDYNGQIGEEVIINAGDEIVDNSTSEVLANHDYDSELSTSYESLQLPDHDYDGIPSAETAVSNDYLTDNLTYGGNDGENDYYFDNQQNEYVMDSSNNLTQTSSVELPNREYNVDSESQTETASTNLKSEFKFDLFNSLPKVDLSGIDITK